MDGFGGFLAGAIVGKMILDRTQWQQSVSKVKGDEKTLAGSAARMSSKFAGVGKAMTLAGGAIVGTLGMMVKSYVRAGDEVHKMALRTGFATETLSELRYAAQISGTDLTSLEKAVKKMQKTIVDASEGMTTYQRAFERIGVSYEELLGLHPEQQFEILAKAIAAVEDPTIRAATAQDIFGRAGTKLLPLFAQGVEGMEALRKKARELGMVFDQEAADKAARLADAQATLKGAMQGLTIAIAENIVPVLSKFVEGLSGVISKISAWMKANPFLASTITKVVTVLGGLMAVFGPMLLLLPKLAAGFTLVRTAMVAATGPVGLAVAAITGLITVGMLVYKNWSKISKFLVNIWHGIKNKAVEIFGKVKEFIIDSLLWLVDKISKIPLAGKFVKPWKEALAEARKEMIHTEVLVSEKSLEMAQAFVDAVKKTDIYKKAMGFLGDKAKVLAGIFSGAKDKTDKLSTSTRDLGVETEAAKKKQQTWIDYLKETGIRTLKQKQDRVKELTNIIADLDKALKDGKISEEEYTVAVTKAREEIELLSGATTTWGKVLEDFGIKTVSQAKKETEYLETAFSLLQKKLKSGEITQEEYNKAVEELEKRLAAATDEIAIMGGQLAVLGRQFDALVPKARNFGDIAADMMPPATAGVTEFKDTVFQELPKTESKFTQVSQRIKDAWTMGLKDMLSGARSFSDVMSSIWGTIKEQFFTLVAQLVSKWTLGLIGGIVSGSGGLLDSVKSVFGGIGKLLTGAEGGGGGGGLFGSIGGSFLGTIGKMAGPLGIGLLIGKMIGFKNISKTVQDAWKAASKVVINQIKNIGKVSDAVFGAISDIVGGIGKAVGGLLTGIGRLLGGAGKKASDVTYWLKIIWENSQNILNELVGFYHVNLLYIIELFQNIYNFTSSTAMFAEGIRDKLGFIAHTKLDQVTAAVDSGISTLDAGLKHIVTTIKDVITAIEKIGSSIAGAQRGAVITKPQLVMAHGTPAAPEYILPSSQLNRLLSASARAPIHQEIIINNEVEITGTIISDREYARQKLIPEIVKALDVNASEMKRKFRRALGVA